MIQFMKSELESRFTNLRFIHFLILSGTICLGAVLLIIGKIDFEWNESIKLLFPSVGILAIIYSFFIAKKLIKPNPPSDSLSDKVSNYFVFKTFQYAVIEFASIFNFIGFANEKNAYALLTATVLLIVLFLLQPKVTEFAERYSYELEELIQTN